MVRLAKNHKWNRSFWQAIAINVIALLVVFLFFEPGASVDDLWPAAILYGAFAGEYVPTLLYSNDLLAVFMVALLKIFPNVAWYYVLFYIFMWVSFTVLTYILLDKCQQGTFWICYLFMVMPAYQDFFVRINFGKTAALIIVAGFALVFRAIELFQKKYVYYLIGLLLIITGSMIRFGMFNMTIMVFFGGFIAFCVGGIRKKNPNLVKQIITFVVALIVIYVSANSVNFLEEKCLEKSSYVKEFQAINSDRSSVQDYAVPDYMEYKDEYEALGISENDYDFYWKKIVMTYDPERYTSEMLKAVRSFTDISKFKGESAFETLRNVMKDFLRVVMAVPEFITFILAVMCLMLLSQISPLQTLISGSMSIIAVIYLMWRGRTTPAVLTAVFFAGTVVVLLLCANQMKRPGKRELLFSVLAVVMIIIVGYGHFSGRGYYGKFYLEDSGELMSDIYEEDLEDIQKAKGLMNEDREHIYMVLEILKRHKWMSYYDIFEVQPPGSMDNIVMMYDFGVQKGQFAKYGIENPWREATDGNCIYLALYAEDIDKIDNFTTYIREHYSPDAKAFLAKKVGRLSVYGFYTGSEALEKYIESYSLEDENEDMVTDMSVLRKNDNCHISGTAYVKGKDSFSQTVIAEIIDNETGEKVYDYLTLSENKTLKAPDKYHGKYSLCQGNVDVSGMSKDISISVYIEVDGQLYRREIQ